MSLQKVISQGGQGASVLFIYLSSSLYYWTDGLTKYEMAVPAAVISYILALTISLYHKRIYKRLYWPVLIQTKKEIDRSTGQKDEYFDYQEFWEKLDQYDDKMYRNTVLMTSGIIIALSLPVQAYFWQGLYGVLIGLLCSLIVSVVIVYGSFSSTVNIIRQTPRLYE